MAAPIVEDEPDGADTVPVYALRVPPPVPEALVEVVPVPDIEVEVEGEGVVGVKPNGTQIFAIATTSCAPNILPKLPHPSRIGGTFSELQTSVPEKETDCPKIHP